MLDPKVLREHAHRAAIKSLIASPLIAMVADRDKAVADKMVEDLIDNIVVQLKELCDLQALDTLATMSATERQVNDIAGRK